VKLGDKIKYDKILVRKEKVERREPHLRTSVTRKVWEEVEVEEATGTVVGSRFLQNGYSRYDGSDVGYVWYREGEVVPCIVVAFDLYHKPIYVPFPGIVAYTDAPDKRKFNSVRSSILSELFRDHADEEVEQLRGKR